MDLTVSGAYGRDYTTTAVALADWDANLDFRIRTIGVPGSYINKADAENYGVGSVKIRFDKDAGFVMWYPEADDEHRVRLPQAAERMTEQLDYHDRTGSYLD